MRKVDRFSLKIISGYFFFSEKKCLIGKLSLLLILLGGDENQARLLKGQSSFLIHIHLELLFSFRTTDCDSIRWKLSKHQSNVDRFLWLITTKFHITILTHSLSINTFFTASSLFLSRYFILFYRTISDRPKKSLCVCSSFCGKFSSFAYSRSLSLSHIYTHSRFMYELTQVTDSYQTTHSLPYERLNLSACFCDNNQTTFSHVKWWKLSYEKFWLKIKF